MRPTSPTSPTTRPTIGRALTVGDADEALAPDPRWERQQLQAHLRRMARAQIVSRQFREALEGPLGFAYGPYDSTPTTPNPAMVILDVFDGERYTSHVYPAMFTTTYVTGER